jgi:hydrogenase maturation protein HypF
VGFRPFVYRLAQREELRGFVRNDTGGVTIELQGTAEQLERFARALDCERPPLVHFQSLTQQELAPHPGEREFRIKPSRTAPAVAADVTVDSALCSDCLGELLSDHDRRAGYGLINCTNCGPRYTIIHRVPYDRPHTTMAGFEMCAACRAEYSNPGDRRFHAQPIACHDCGPKVQLVSAAGRRLSGEPISQAVKRLNRGEIVAIKGLGGFHLAVRADDEQAVDRLRKLKQRDRKPFALMAESLIEARKWVALSGAAEQAMTSPACPIVIAPRKEGSAVARGIAPGNHRLGVMLPYTPIHHLLFASTMPRLQGARLLVMTSGNHSDEPLVIDNDEALARLGGMCDAILWHDRPIERSVDDSVLLDAGGALLPVRRARGYVPAALDLPVKEGPPGLCVGGELKNTIAMVRDGRAILSHHLGDLTHALALRNFSKSIDDMRELFGVEPRWIAHDLHPMYLSTVRAGELGEELGVPLMGVQHHHAHAASVMAEHGERGPVLAVVCDGTGYGQDGQIWGGELLLADLHRYRRLARLKPLALAGGDAAARDTRRCGLALLQQALGEDFDQHQAAKALFRNDAERHMLSTMLRQGVCCAMSSGAGRVFDGAAALLGLCMHNDFEAQAGLALEAAASSIEHVKITKRGFAIEHNEIVEISLAPFVREMIDGRAKGYWPEMLAAMFHEQLAWAFETVVTQAAEATKVRTVALSGGVFCNQRLSQSLSRRLRERGMTVLTHRLVPANDGGLSLGQAAVAMARLELQSTGKAGG